MTDLHLIDDVAREMTTGDPAAGFEGRVMERVAVEVPAPRVRWGASLWLAAPGAAVIVVFGGLAVLREPQRTAEPPSVVAAVDAASAVPDTAHDPVAIDEPVGPAARRATRRVEPIPEPASVIAWRARAIPELTAVVPLAFDEIQPDRLSITQLDVTPLGIRPIAFPTGRGDGGGRW